MIAKRTYLAICLLLFYPLQAAAQFNDSTFYHIHAAATGSLNKTNDVRSYLLNNSLRFGVKKEQVSFNLNSTWVYGLQQNTITNNDFAGSLDLNYYGSNPRFYCWGLGNYVTNLSLKVNNQYQAGAGAAYNIFDDSVFYLNISDGILYENSDIVLADTMREVYNTFRNSLRISFSINVNHRFTIRGVGFLQNSLQYANDYILRTNLSASLKLRKWLSVTAALNFNKISRTGRENLLATYGITIDDYF